MIGISIFENIFQDSWMSQIRPVLPLQNSLAVNIYRAKDCKLHENLVRSDTDFEYSSALTAVDKARVINNSINNLRIERGVVLSNFRSTIYFI